MQAPTEIELFVLQRCWFSGPHHEPSVDCLRLFTSRREAEEVGFHAAHEFANQSIFSTTANRNNNTTPAPVKTILLPPSTFGAVTSSYAFQTCGKLFWVRSMKATIIPPTSFDTMFSFGNTCPYTTAQVVLTHGIIGGTGNPNSRRGSEVSEGRVFVSMDETLAVQTAVEVGKQVHLAMSNNPNVKITVAALPIGKPQFGTNSSQDWPPSSSSSSMLENTNNNSNNNIQQQQQQQQQHAAHPMSIVAGDPSNKREWMTMTTAANGTFQQSNPNLPSKRQCQVSLSS